MGVQCGEGTLKIIPDGVGPSAHFRGPRLANVHQDGTAGLGVGFGSPLTCGAGCQGPGHILNDTVSGKAVTSSPPPPPQGRFLEEEMLELEGPMRLFPTRRRPCLSGSQN